VHLNQAYLSPSGNLIIYYTTKSAIIQQDLVNNTQYAVLISFAEEKQLFKIIKLIIAKATNKYHEVLLVNSYICQNISTYNQYTCNVEDGNITGVLINKKARCEGVAKFASLILRILGQNVSMIHGYVKDEHSPYIRHAWNLIYFDNNYYHLDFAYNKSYSAE
jgi:transglutaminase/protease-like cytokinesis protein 3